MDRNVNINVIVKIIHHAIQLVENVSVIVAGWDEHAMKNVQMDILVKIVRKGVQKICHQKQLVIMLLVTINVVLVTLD